MTTDLPFVGRKREFVQLTKLHARHKHVLLVGPPGIGKTALVEHLHAPLGLRVCPASERLSEICEALERELGLEAGKSHLAERKNRLLKTLRVTRRAVVFDGLTWTTPKLSGFIEAMSQRVPVWICTRSEHPWDIGHIWPLLTRFDRLELPPFHLHETCELVETAVRRSLAPADALNSAAHLHRLAHGNPRTLCAFLTRLRSQHYDLSSVRGWRLLDLDRRIEQLPAFGKATTS